MADAIPLVLLREVQSRMVAAQVIANVDRIRINHRTVVTRDEAPAVYVRPPTDAFGKDHGGCNVDHALAFTVSVFVIADDDATYDAAFPIISAVLQALDPNLSPAFPSDATLTVQKISFDDEIADGDAMRADIELQFGYNAAAWSLLGA